MALPKKPMAPIVREARCKFCDDRMVARVFPRRVHARDHETYDDALIACHVAELVAAKHAEDLVHDMEVAHVSWCEK